MRLKITGKNITLTEGIKEAVKEKKKNSYKIKIIEAKNFKQVLEELAK